MTVLNNGKIKTQAQLQAEIDQQKQAFLNQGGKIQVIPSGSDKESNSAFSHLSLMDLL